jgi:predicted DNA-binding antitoxin AbrB/MazE fold protein
MPKGAAKVVEAIYEHGVFRPVRKVTLPDRSRVRLTLVPLGAPNSKTRDRLVKRQRKALLDIAGIGASGRTDISENPHRALYGTDRAR